MSSCGCAQAFEFYFGRNGPFSCGSREANGAGWFVERLNDSEIQSLELPPQTTLTVYGGPCPESWLGRRVQDILAANPWVAGVLKTNPNDGRLALWFPEQPQHATVFQSVQVEPDASVQHASVKFHVKSGSELADGAQPICQITALTQPARQRWILQMSMSHAVADGHTFYAIYGMLDTCAKLWPMKVKRIAFNPVTSLKAPLHWKWLFFTLCRLSWLMSPWTRSARPPVITVRYVNERWLEDQKSTFVPEVDSPHISTNDLLTSWFLSVTEPACGFIPMNMRARAPGLADEHAGLYTTMLIFYPEEYKSSANIRRAVTRLSPACTPDASRRSPGPGSCCGAVSAWRMFYCDVNLPGCKRLSHFPDTSTWQLDRHYEACSLTKLCVYISKHVFSSSTHL